MDTIILVGFMGAGKTTVGKILAERLNTKFYDMDDVFIDSEQTTIANYFAKHGEDGFRKRESELLVEYYQKPAIIATGGGVVTKKENRDLLSSLSNVIYLESDASTLWDRVVHDETIVRPLIHQSNLETTKELLDTRLAFYEEVASKKINTTNVKPNDVADLVLEAMKELKDN